MGATSQRVWGKATVLDTCEVAENVRQIVLEPEKAGPAAPPGSHIDVGVYVNGRSDVRSYSVVSNGAYGSELVLGVQLARQSKGGSIFMHSLRRGAKLTVTRPLQNFPLTYGRPGYVLLAGGIGVTALVGMAKDLKRRGADYRFVYGARSRNLLAFADELERDHGDRLELHCDDEGSSIDIPKLVAGIGPGVELYVCGPIPMLDAVKRAWAAEGRPQGSLRFESFGSSGRFAPEPFRVRIPRLGMEMTVPHDSSMLEALEQRGTEVMYDCRRGECGLCTVKVVGIDGAIDHRDVFLSDDQHKVGDRMQSCVSRVVAPRTAGMGAGETAVIEIDLP